VCWQLTLCDPHLGALEVRFSRRCAIQIDVYLTLPYRPNFDSDYSFGAETAYEVTSGLVLVSANRVTAKLRLRPLVSASRRKWTNPSTWKYSPRQLHLESIETSLNLLPNKKEGWMQPPLVWTGTNLREARLPWSTGTAFWHCSQYASLTPAATSNLCRQRKLFSMQEIRWSTQ